jgi:hypothetical protein
MPVNDLLALRCIDCFRTRSTLGFPGDSSNMAKLLLLFESKSRAYEACDTYLPLTPNPFFSLVIVTDRTIWLLTTAPVLPPYWLQEDRVRLSSLL